jgi:hypothetical protein
MFGLQWRYKRQAFISLNLYNTLLNSDRLIGCLWSHDIEKKIPFPKSAMHGIRFIALFASAIVYYTFYSIALFVFSINRIRQNASHTNLLVYFGII